MHRSGILLLVCASACAGVDDLDSSFGRTSFSLAHEITDVALTVDVSEACAGMPEVRVRAPGSIESDIAMAVTVPDDRGEVISGRFGSSRLHGLASGESLIVRGTQEFDVSVWTYSSQGTMPIAHRQDPLDIIDSLRAGCPDPSRLDTLPEFRLSDHATVVAAWIAQPLGFSCTDVEAHPDPDDESALPIEMSSGVDPEGDWWRFRVRLDQHHARSDIQGFLSTPFVCVE